MKTSELIERLEAYGLKVEIIKNGYGGFIHVYSQQGTIAYISKEQEFEIDNCYEPFGLLPSQHKKIISDVLFEYARTPLEYR